ncbi:uncharacterized [Tachysurus ichikawai]
MTLMLQPRLSVPQQLQQQHVCTYMLDSAARAPAPSQHHHRCRILFLFACFPDTLSSASPRPRLVPLLSSPLPTPPFIPLLALPPAAASKPLTASGEMADWKYASCPSIIREVGGGAEGCTEGRQGARKEKSKVA